MLEAKAKDQGHRFSVLKKKVFKNLFQAISQRGKRKKSSQIFRELFGVFQQTFNDSKKQCCLRAENRAIFEDLRLRGQGQGVDLRGQGLQNVSPRTSPLLVSVTNHLLHYFSLALNLHHASFYAFLKKKLAGEMLIEKII